MLELVEALENAKEEFKRADHLLYVSLKYTRTVDVIKSIVERLINTFDFTFEALILAAKKNKIWNGDIPEFPRPRAELVAKVYKNDIFKHYLQFYLLLRRIDKARFDSFLEFRRHVKMSAHLEENQSIEITIDIINDYFERTKEFLAYVENIIEEKEED